MGQASFQILLYYKGFYNLNYNKPIDEQLGMSVSCCLGLSSCLGLTQQW